MTVAGTCTDAFAPLRDLLERNLADGTDSGASVAVVQDGELVADLWGGEARPGEPWQEDTVVQVWSVTKTMAALAACSLAAPVNTASRNARAPPCSARDSRTTRPWPSCSTSRTAAASARPLA